MIRIILADDEALLRDAVATTLGLEVDIKVVGVASNGAEALDLARRKTPDVAVLDLQMPEMDGIEVATALADESSKVKSLIVTSHALPGVLKMALKAGVAGFTPKNTSAIDLANIIRRVASGEIYIHPKLAVEAAVLGDNPLTPREIEMLRLAIGGTSVDTIVEQSAISLSTVRNHLHSASTKLGAANRHEAIHIAQLRGWI